MQSNWRNLSESPIFEGNQSDAPLLNANSVTPWMFLKPWIRGHSFIDCCLAGDIIIVAEPCVDQSISSLGKHEYVVYRYSRSHTLFRNLKGGGRFCGGFVSFRVAHQKTSTSRGSRQWQYLVGDLGIDRSVRRAGRVESENTRWRNAASPLTYAGRLLEKGRAYLTTECSYLPRPE